MSLANEQLPGCLRVEGGCRIAWGGGGSPGSLELLLGSQRSLMPLCCSSSWLPSLVSCLLCPVNVAIFPPGPQPKRDSYFKGRGEGVVVVVVEKDTPKAISCR